MDRRIIVSGVISGIVAGAIFYVFTLLGQVTVLRDQLRIVEASNRIANDQIGELTYQLLQKNTEDKFANMREFVSGAVDSLRRPEYYSEVWHAGYDRGVVVEQYARKLDIQDAEGKTYTKSQE
jgi:hypothetical protein